MKAKSRAVAPAACPAPTRRGWRCGALLAALALTSLQAAAGIITAASTRAALGGNDSVAWGTAADDFTFVASPYARTSVGGVGVSASTPGGTFAIFENGGVAFSSNFAPGDIVLDTFFNDGPISISFGSAVRGVGFNIAHEVFGSFVGTLEFFGAGNVLFDTVVVNGNATVNQDDSAVFLGGTSSLRDIVRVDVSVSQSGGSRALAINQMSLLTSDPSNGTVPEPASLGLAGAALAAAVLARRRRAAAAR